MLVYIVRDNRPGHFRQCEGVASALARIAPLEVRNVFPNFHWFSRRIIPTIAYRLRLPASLVLGLLYDFEVETLDPPDIVIASGHRNVVPALLIARLFGARFVYAGIHDRRYLDEMDMVVTPCPRDAYEPRHVYAPVLNPVSRKDFPLPRRLTGPEDLRGARLGLMLGGETRTHRFTTRDWRQLARLISETRRDLGIEWWATTSRRTPRAARKFLKSLVKSGDLHKFIEYDPAMPGSPNEVLGLDGTLVTEDSMAMLSEALTAGRPVIALKPSMVWPSRQDEAVTAMAAMAGTPVIPISELNVERMAAALTRGEPVSFEPIEVLQANLLAAPHLLAALGLVPPHSPAVEAASTKES
ncbi:mitochondrial fission ELM1 family protein [Prosthecomicrobium hirschii]|uniref:mitochondrial fission ELM1 family protein n=1 Tax=Prosthecodimorpha hirschii TaxID=665126 RepID=UPI00221E7DC9|nr:mitochondrial fission ELM1 family protein [Prosthecomicrobium hirschii]MCW1840701.1 mitochondrial fission ELM1 family protein [Prosthecomicrobium hirschii]